MRNIAYQYRLYPDSSQQVMLKKTFGCCRFIYNRMLYDKKAAYEKDRKMPRITPAAYKKEYEWLKEVDSLALANVQLHLEKAYQRFFDSSANRYPRYKSKHDSSQSYTTNVVNGNIRIEGNRIRLPKVGMVKIRLHRKAPEEWRLKSVTVRMEASGEYYASLLYEENSPKRAVPAALDRESENQAFQGKDHRDTRILGIDYAMHGLAVFSDGTRADYPGYYRKGQEKLAREQRRLSRCRKGSRNYEKQRRKAAKCHRKVRNQRKDFQHKLSRKIADRYDAVAVEDINMKGMSRSLHFGKSVMDNGYGMFREMLGYKLERQGKKLIKVDRFYPSSKRCSCCGAIKEELRLDERIYICACGNRMDRDINAAVNIREEGRRLLSA